MKSILIVLHTPSNTGFAINSLEATFFQMALELCNQDASRIHFAYPSMGNGPTPALPREFQQYVLLNFAEPDPLKWMKTLSYIKENHIDTIFAFDQPVHRPIYKHLRRAGVTHFISYWGAPMSSISGRLRLAIKRLEVALRPNGPDHYIFESHGMADMAVKGRGIPKYRTSVIPTGIDLCRYSPNVADSEYVYRAFGIPRERRIFFYSGHMENRKGVPVIMEAANHLSELHGNLEWQILLCGNRPGEEVPLIRLLSEKARQRVSFGGYRTDLNLLQRGCYAGVIASTGWDSFPMSAIEMQASALPVIVSDLPGIRETIVDGESGLLFPTGNSWALSNAFAKLLADGAFRDKLAVGGRQRAENVFSRERQLKDLVYVVQSVVVK